MPSRPEVARSFIVSHGNVPARSRSTIPGASSAATRRATARICSCSGRRPKSMPPPVLAALEGRRTLLQEGGARLPVVLSGLEHALAEPFQAAPRLGVDVGAGVQDELGHAER